MRQHARPAALHAAFPSDHEALHRPGGHCPAQRAGSPGNREHMPLRTHDALGSPGARLKMDPPEDLIKAAQPVPRERRPCPARLVLHSSPQLSWAGGNPPLDVGGFGISSGRVVTDRRPGAQGAACAPQTLFPETMGFTVGDLGAGGGGLCPRPPRGSQILDWGAPRVAQVCKMLVH